MAFTHALVGALVAAPVVALAPELAVPAALAGVVGGLVPDVDLFVGRHRRTLHFPVLGWALAVPAVAVAVAVPTLSTVSAATFAASFAVHAGTDALGAGDEIRPWERTSSEAVFDHLHGRWIRPRYRIRYDGAPEDAAATAVLAVPVVAYYPRPLPAIAAACVALGVAYALVRRRLPPVVEEFVG
ncbi:metal-dependent hydrolase [Halobaculum sp. CBA1158]|uniref:metal-dependent hydrolase n=1 Tax=Halobaculum sp. CBA1158 TaxID=2904243 RepID=UPI001F46DD16|nr:metal-dependent hydrolase [Halobaculum sp. CBA1158]UIO99999.1 metal-dependent hydrolase [Halobaculum sp. CBA1158]